MGENPPKVSWLVRIASDSGIVARNVAGKVLEADLAQTIMVLITVAAGITYGWIEGYVINATLGNQSLLPYVLFNHFTMYQFAVGTLLGLITGSFALIKARSMFAKGNRYFLFACLGNWPFSWLVEDFTYFLFNPLDALSSTHWSTWILGGVYAYSPWMPGHPKPEFFIPTWYFLVFFWFLGCNLYAHRCTVYDNLLKDEIGQRILPKVLPKAVQDEPQGPARIPAPVPTPQPPTPKKAPVTVSLKKPTKPVEPTPKPKVRSDEAEAALKRLRERRLKDDQAQSGD
jgi:hypothetical protein